MESDLLHILKELFFILIGPVMGLFVWLGKRLNTRIDKMEDKIIELDKAAAVQQTKLIDLKEDIHNIDKKLDKILDKVRK